MCRIRIPPRPRGAPCLCRANTPWRRSSAVCDVTRGQLPVHLLALRRILLTLVNNGALNLALYDTVKGRGNNDYFKKQVQGFYSRFPPTCQQSTQAGGRRGGRPGRAWAEQGETSVRRRPCGDFTLLAVQMI